MPTMEWREVHTEQSDWKRQIDIVAYYGSQTIGSIILRDGERSWDCVIDGNIEFLDAETEEEAKKEMIERLEEHFENEINYYRELIESLDELGEGDNS